MAVRLVPIYSLREQKGRGIRAEAKGSTREGHFRKEPGSVRKTRTRKINVKIKPGIDLK